MDDLWQIEKLKGLRYRFFREEHETFAGSLRRKIAACDDFPVAITINFTNVIIKLIPVIEVAGVRPLHVSYRKVEGVQPLVVT